MDSPFLPRLPRADDTDDGTLVLADLSLLPDDEDDSPLAHTVPLPRASAPPPLTAKSHLRGPSTSASASQSQSQSLAGSQPSRLFSSQRSDTAADDLHGSGSGASGEQQPESGDEGPSDKHEADLRATLAQLRQLNNVMDGCLHAIEVTSERNKSLSEQVGYTRALLSEYTSLLGQTAHTKELLLNTKWTGQHDDAEAVLAAQLAKEEEERRAAAEAIRLQEEAEERAEEDRQRAQRAAAAAESAGSRGRGRGTGIRGGLRGRGAAHTGIPSRTTRPTGAAGARGRPGSASAGRYGYVGSSGYGPRRD